ncbi:MHS family proline/betaine transporter-like MFS transporter [Saccharopolyspora phatthalungensis]|uniref:MHS family proline/betaine transporter-like MFS transporter n=1 Tax=Saccharopolyspora phatthalungensis TaxID=664693 RepID=A0A840QJQ1_9PSEU|nr:MHS family proline/betaine transporter-like MFS transporter [Saccharopolyspora phatthalungensis]
MMLLSMLLMAAGSLVIGLSPSYAAIGALAPALILIGRLMQGFSAGGEFGSAAVYLTEWASPGRRGFFGSFHQVGTYGGLLLGLFVVATLTSAVGPDEVKTWAWRVPFLLGALLAIIVLVLRRGIGETPEFQELTNARMVEPDTGSAVDSPTDRPISSARGFFLAVGVVALWSVTSFVTINYMPTFATAFTTISATAALWATAIGCVVAVALIPVAGNLSDKVGRRPLIIGAALTYIIASLPLFWLVVSVPSFGSLVLVQVLFAIPTSAIAGAGTATISELFGTHNRGSLVSIASAISVAVFGGSGGYAATLLIKSTGFKVSLTFYIIAVAIITLVAALNLPRTDGLSRRGQPG